MKPKPLTREEERRLLLLQRLIPVAIESICDNGALPVDYLEFLQGCQGSLRIISEGASDDTATVKYVKNTATAIALLAFEPGGVSFFGVHYEAKF